MAKIREVYALYGFEAVETPFIEYTEALGKFLPDLDRPNEGVFSFKDDDEQWLSLRYDLTAPLARYVAENYEKLPKPYRSYRAGWVFRNEKPGPGRFRQFMQFDADTVGAASPAADAEMCMMAADCLEALGIKRGDYVIKVNNRKVLDGVMEAIGLGGAENAGRRLTVLRAIDKLDRLGPEGVRALLGAGRKDESGDFTRGAGCRASSRQRNAIVVARLRRVARLRWRSNASSTTKRALERRCDVAWLEAEVRRGPSGRRRATANLRHRRACRGRWLRRRTHPDRSLRRARPRILHRPGLRGRADLREPGEDGKPVRFGSVGGGGRYDGLVARFRGEPVPATGFSIGVSRLLAALRAIDSPIVAAAASPARSSCSCSTATHHGRLPAPRRALARRGHRRRTLSRARRHERAAQIRRPARRRCAVIQGSNERDAPGGPQVAIRDLALGAELAKASKDRADYLELRQRAQFAAPEAELVERVREVLGAGRQGGAALRRFVVARTGRPGGRLSIAGAG